MSYPELVETYEQALESAKNFNMADHIGRLTSFKHWYYFEEIDAFAPSKFVGYKNMTASDYEYYSDWRSRDFNNESYLHGSDTQDVFKRGKWFKETDDPVIWEKLQKELGRFDKKIRKGSVVYVRR